MNISIILIFISMSIMVLKWLTLVYQYPALLCLCHVDKPSTYMVSHTGLFTLAVGGATGDLLILLVVEC